MFRMSVNGLFAAVLVLSGCSRDRLDGLPLLHRSQESIEIASPLCIAAPPAAAATGLPADPRITRTAEAVIVVASVDSAVDSLTSIVRSVSGLIGKQVENEDNFGARTSTITCRVPAGTLDSILPVIRRLGRVESMSIISSEITEQYLDLEARLASKKTLETSLLRLLERKTDDLAALVQVEGEISRVRGEIEQMEGRRRLWDNQIALSTLKVEFHTPEPKLAARDGGALRRLGRSFHQAGDNFVQTLAWLVAAIGVIVPVGLALFGLARLLAPVWRRTRRVRHARIPAKE